MKPVAFDYHRPNTVAEAVALLADMREQADVLAGGMTLGPMLNMRLVRPRAVVDITRIESLRTIIIKGNMVVTGACVVQSDALRSELVARELPLLTLALPLVGHFQTRNRGTLGGSVAHADPSAEIPLALVASGGTVVLQSRRRERRVPAGEFFLGALATARQPDELIIALEWPRTAVGGGLRLRRDRPTPRRFRHRSCGVLHARRRLRLLRGIFSRSRRSRKPAHRARR